MAFAEQMTDEGGHRAQSLPCRSLSRLRRQLPQRGSQKNLPPPRGKVAFAKQMTDEGGPEDTPGPTHRSAPTVDNGRSLFCGARLPRRAHAPRHSVGRDDLGAPPPLGAHLCVRPWGKATTPLYGHVGAAICRPQTSAGPLRTGGHRPPLQNHRKERRGRCPHRPARRGLRPAPLSQLR